MMPNLPEVPPIGQILRQVREQQGLSRRDVVTRLSNRFGRAVHPDTLRHIEHGRRPPHPVILLELMQIYALRGEIVLPYLIALILRKFF